MHRSVAYIVEGLLDRSVERDIPLTVVDGGEIAVGYYNPSPEALRKRILRRAEVVRPLLEKYRGRYVLAGTIAPYADASKITGWLERRAGDNQPYKTLADFEPLFRILFSTYRFVWIYAASAAKFFPFRPDSAREYHPQIERFLRKFGGRSFGGESGPGRQRAEHSARRSRQILNVRESPRPEAFDREGWSGGRLFYFGPPCGPSGGRKPSGRREEAGRPHDGQPAEN